MFRGRHQHTVDSKGRTSFPVRFRELLEARGERRLVVTAGLDPCLVAYPVAEWERFEARLASLPQFDRSVTLLRRLYVSGATECDLDKSGRILIPSALRKHASLKREALWAGMGTHIELWAVDAFEAETRAAVSDPGLREAMLGRLAELGL